MGFSLSKLAKGALGGVMGLTTSLIPGLNLGGEQQQAAAGSIEAGKNVARGDVTSGFKKAQDALSAGTTGATTAATGGFQKAQNLARTGYNTAGQQLAAGGQRAVDTLKQGFEEAKGKYATPEMVATKNELYQRILGQGGYSEDVRNAMEAKTREEYGTGLRGAESALSSFYGDSQAPGMAGENLARAAASLGGQRANAIRDIEVGNAQLARQEQTGAIASMQNQAYQEAGLSADEATAVSGLQQKIAEGGANLSAQEAQALSTLAAQEGTTVAELKARMAQSGAQLSAEEASALANIMLGTATNLASIQTEPYGIGKILGT